MTQPDLISLDQITKAYAAVDSQAAPQVLRGVTLSVQAGESLAIVGPSGCGKSTLLNIIGGLVRPTSGTVAFEGRDLYAANDAELAAFRNGSVGFVFQSHHLLPQCSAIENVLIPTIVHEDASMKNTAPERARALLERVGLGDRMAHRPGQLSGGECQRVAVARALINEPRLLLADEPTGSLDEDAAGQLADLLLSLNTERGVTLIVVTHSLHLADRMQRGLSLRRGVLSDRGEESA